MHQPREPGALVAITRSTGAAASPMGRRARGAWGVSTVFSALLSVSSLIAGRRYTSADVRGRVLRTRQRPLPVPTAQTDPAGRGRGHTRRRRTLGAHRVSGTDGSLVYGAVAMVIGVGLDLIISVSHSLPQSGSQQLRTTGHGCSSGAASSA